MTQPTLECGALSVTLKHPIDWEIPVVSGGAETVSLDGTMLRDIPWRKYRYILKWPAMTTTDFEDLEDLVNLNNNYGLAITFTYDRWRNTNAGVIVNAKLIEREFAAGCYQGVELILTEIDPQAIIS